MTRTLALLALPFTLPLALAGCGETPAPEPEATAEAESPQDAFWAALSSHCGKAYAGRMVSDEEVDAEMRGADMAMHVRECSEREIRVPFHVRTQGGEWDRSRTWILTRTGADGAEGLRLKHDHRHEDGSEDAVTPLANSQHLQAVRPATLLAVLEGAGHAPHVRDAVRSNLLIAEFLESHPKVKQVRYPGLESFPQHALAKRQASGFGAMLWFEVEGGVTAGKKVRFTPKGLLVISRQRAISLASSSGVRCVSPVMMPRPPALETAAASSASPT